MVFWSTRKIANNRLRDPAESDNLWPVPPGAPAGRLGNTQGRCMKNREWKTDETPWFIFEKVITDPAAVKILQSLKQAWIHTLRTYDDYQKVINSDLFPQASCEHTQMDSNIQRQPQWQPCGKWYHVACSPWRPRRTPGEHTGKLCKESFLENGRNTRIHDWNLLLQSLSKWRYTTDSNKRVFKHWEAMKTCRKR